MITSLSMKFKTLLLQDVKEKLEVQSKQELLDKFAEIKNTYLDKQLVLLEKEVNAIRGKGEVITNAAKAIDESCDKIVRSYINIIKQKLETFEVKSHAPRVLDIDGLTNARDLGGVFVSADDYLRVFDKIDHALGASVAENLHCHFSKIEWTGSGEKRHLTFDDEIYGPNFEPLIETIYKHNLSPTIICESAGTQSDDALAMKKYYQELCK